MLLVCQSIRPWSLCGWGNQAIFAAQSPTAIRNIRPFRLRRKQIPETSRSGTSTTRHTRSRFFFDLPFPVMERVFADIKENVQPLPDDFSSFLRPRKMPLGCDALVGVRSSGPHEHLMKHVEVG